MKINRTIPKDKSSYVYYADKGRDLIATKPLLIIYKLITVYLCLLLIISLVKLIVIVFCEFYFFLIFL